MAISFPRSFKNCATAICIALSMILLPFFSAAAQEKVQLQLENLECYDQKGERRKPYTENDLERCRIGDWVRIGVDSKNFADWADEDKSHVLKNLVLSLNGELIAGNTARISEKQDTLKFRLSRIYSDAENITAWKSVLARSNLLSPAQMEVGVALIGTPKRFIVDGDEKIEVEVASGKRIVLMGGFYFVFLMALGVAAHRTNILCDAGPPDSLGRKTFSLGRTQMAFWFVIVLGAYLFVWIVIGDYNVLTTAIVGLTGISAVTALTSAVVPETKEPTDGEKTKSELIAEKAKLKEFVDANPGSPEAATKSDRIAEILEAIESLDKKLDAVKAHRKKISAFGRFILDIISSDGEVSLTRLQMVIWTFVLGIIFLHATWTTLSMPEFSATLLALMGLSNGTYVGFKASNIKGGS